MKKRTSKRMLYGLTVVMLLSALITSCSKDPVAPNEEHNHDDPSKVALLFIKGHYHGTQLHAHDTTTVAVRMDGRFIDPQTNALLDKAPVITLEQGSDIYQLQIKFYAPDGDLLNGEFLEEAAIHQFFFLPSVNDVLNYVYKDDRVGFTGDFSVLQTGKELSLTASLRHGINKTIQREWNDIKYNTYGSEDFKTVLQLKTVAAGAHDHD